MGVFAVAFPLLLLLQLVEKSKKVRRLRSTPGTATEEPEAVSNLLFLPGFSHTSCKGGQLVDCGSKGIGYHREETFPPPKIMAGTGEGI